MVNKQLDFLEQTHAQRFRNLEKRMSRIQFEMKTLKASMEVVARMKHIEAKVVEFQLDLFGT